MVTQSDAFLPAGPLISGGKLAAVDSYSTGPVAQNSFGYYDGYINVAAPTVRSFIDAAIGTQNAARPPTSSAIAVAPSTSGAVQTANAPKASTNSSG